jgi:hypothetical protein
LTGLRTCEDRASRERLKIPERINDKVRPRRRKKDLDLMILKGVLPCRGRSK